MGDILNSLDWPYAHHDLRRTGFTILKGDIQTADDIDDVDVTLSQNIGNKAVSRPSIADVDNNDRQEIVVATYDRIDTDQGYVFSVEVDHGIFWDNAEEKWFFNASSAIEGAPSIADIDGDDNGLKEVVVATRKNDTIKVLDINAAGDTATLKWSYQAPKRYSAELGTEVHGQLAHTLILDIDLDGEKEIIFADNLINYPDWPSRVMVLDKNGNLEYSYTIGNGGGWGAISAANIDDDDYPELIVPSYYGIYVLDYDSSSNNLTEKWSNSDGKIETSGVIYDIDKDNEYEIIYAASTHTCHASKSCDDRIFVYEALTGNPEENFPINELARVNPTIANLDDDDDLEITVVVRNSPVLGENLGNVITFDYDSTERDWQYNNSDALNTSYIAPTIVDIDGDGEYNVLFIGDSDTKMYVLKEDGTKLFDYSFAGAIGSSLAVGDIDQDGIAEVAVKHAGSDEVSVLGGFNKEPILNNISNLSIIQNDLADINLSGEIWAKDSNNDSLTFNYSWPFNSSGMWKTNKSSAGDYYVKIEVSDGDLSDWQYIYVQVNDTLDPIIANETNYTNNQLNYTFSVEIDEDCYCTLWANWSGTWKQNETVFLSTGKLNITAITFSGDGSFYQWGTNCTDPSGKHVWGDNISFGTIDLGNLSIDWVTPTINMNHTQHQLKLYQFEVTCNEGECNNVTVLLDPEVNDQEDKGFSKVKISPPLISEEGTWTILEQDYITKYIDYNFVYIGENQYRVDWRWNNENVKNVLNECATMSGDLLEACLTNDDFVNIYFSGESASILKDDLVFLKTNDMPHEIINGNAIISGIINPLMIDNGNFSIELKDGTWNSNGLKIKWGLNTTLAEFSNSKSEENLTLSEFQTEMRYLKIKAGTNVTSATFDLQPYPGVTNVSYDPDTMNSTTSSNGCSGDVGANGTGIYLTRIKKTSTIDSQGNVSGYINGASGHFDTRNNYIWEPQSYNLAIDIERWVDPDGRNDKGDSCNEINYPKCVDVTTSRTKYANNVDCSGLVPENPFGPTCVAQSSFWQSSPCTGATVTAKWVLPVDWPGNTVRCSDGYIRTGGSDATLGGCSSIGGLGYTYKGCSPFVCTGLPDPASVFTTCSDGTNSSHESNLCGGGSLGGSTPSFTVGNSDSSAKISFNDEIISSGIVKWNITSIGNLIIDVTYDGVNECDSCTTTQNDFDLNYSLITQNLTNCAQDGDGYCLVPIYFSATAGGILEISDIAIEYDGDAPNGTGLVNYTQTGLDYTMSAQVNEGGQCSLWGNWSGSWAMNETKPVIANVSFNFTTIYFVPGSHNYLWGLNCSDVLANHNWTENVSLTISDFKHIITNNLGQFPFYHNGTTTEYDCGDMLQDEICMATFWVNATGGLNVTHEFYAILNSNVPDYYTIIINSTTINVTVVGNATLPSPQLSLINLTDSNQNLITDSNQVETGENATIYMDVTSDTEVDSVWITVWETIAEAGDVLWQGILSLISGNLFSGVWSTEIPVNDSFGAVANYTVYVNDTIGNEANISNNFSVKYIPTIANLTNYSNDLLNYIMSVQSSKDGQCTLYGNWSGSWAKNETQLAKADVQLNFTNIDFEINNQNLFWGVNCSDNFTNTNWSTNITFMTINFTDTEKFYVRNSSDITVAWFGDQGNVVLEGSLTQSTTPSATANDEFRVQDASGNDVMIIDETNGNMYLNGTLFENQGTLSSTSNDYIIQDSSNNVVAYVNESGYLFLKGILIQNGNP